MSYGPFQLNDPVGQSTAKVNIMDLRKVLGMAEMSSFEFESFTENSQTAEQKGSDDGVSGGSPPPGGDTSSTSSGQRQFRVRRQSMEQLDLIKVFIFLFCFIFPYLSVVVVFLGVVHQHSMIN